MAVSLLERTQERLDLYYAAEKAILLGQSYTIGSKSLTRANLAWVKSQIDVLESKVASLQSSAAGKGYRKAFRITPRDL
jgi:hypothetical protein